MTLNSVAETLNSWGSHFVRFAWPVLWQSSLLIVAMFLLDLLVRRKLRPAVRYALWLLVLVKLLLPPSFAFPTSLGWWVRAREVVPIKQPAPAYTVIYGPYRATAPLPASNHRVLPPLQIRLSSAAWILVAISGTGLALLSVMLWRWRRLQHELRQSQPTPIWLAELVSSAQRQARYRRTVRIILTKASISPALWGLFRPVIVLPATLIDGLTPRQLRAVLLHELFHLRNGDVWLNCFQSLLQIAYWWHPLLWFANARIRRIREEAIDDAVTLALGDEAETYPPTLLEVARLALARPLATLGLVGILESRHALKQRVDRLLNFPAPRKVGLSIISSFAILAFASVALPMGQAPPRNIKPTRRDAPTIYYTFDQSFLDYFGSNGVEAVNHVLAQNSDLSNLSQNDAKALGFDYYLGNVLKNGAMELQGGPRYTTDSSEPPMDSRAPNSQAGLADSAGSKTAIFGEPGFDAIAGTALGLQPLTDNGWVEYNMATGIATATNGAVLTYGDTTLSADNITLNRPTGEVVAKGSVSLKASGAYLPMGGRLSGNVTNLLFAQVQPSVVHPPPRRQLGINGRMAIVNKLNAIRLNNVVFDNLPLSEVVNYLSSESKKRDPEGKGINFILMPYVGAAAPGTIDPATGVTVVPSQADVDDINTVSIRLSRPLNDVRMADVLDAITKVADKRIRYSIEDYAVSFRLAGNETPVPLFSRTIKVDPGAFAQGLESVVGVSVGNFQTGGQGGGGGGQQNGSGVTFPRVQAAPNGGAGQGGQGGVQGGGGISGVTKPTTMVSPQAVRQFFANAGVDLAPPKSIFYNDRSGSLMVHATMDDLDLIEKAVGGLGGFSAPQTVTPNHAASNEATTRLYRNEQFVGEQKVELSGGTNPFTFSQPADQKKIPVLGDLPIAGKVLTRTVEVAAATSPPTSSASVTDTLREKLFTRTIRADANNFFTGIQRRTGLSEKATPEELIGGFRKLLLDDGVQLLAPKTMFYNANAETLYVRATEQDLGAIEQKVMALSVPPPQVVIKVKFIEIAKGDTLYFLALLKDLRNQNPASSTLSPVTTPNSDLRSPLAEIITDAQFRDLLSAVKQRDGADLLNEASVTTLSGRQAQIQIADIKTIVVKINPQALVLPGVSSTNLFITENLPLGPVLDVVPVVADDGMTVSLDVSANVLGFIGYDAPAETEKVDAYIEGKRVAIKPPHPRMRSRELLHTVASVPDGQTLLLGKPTDLMITYDKDGKTITEPGAEKKDLLVFVTTTLIDPAGNPVHR